MTSELSSGMDRTGGILAGKHFLHAFASFNSGGIPIRIANVLNHMGPGVRHSIVAMDGGFAARSHLDPCLDVTFRSLQDIPSNPLRAVTLLRAELRAWAPDLLLSYNWGAVEWGLANLIAPLCPQIHFESGFGPEEAEGQLARRVWTRRLALRRCHRLVVPSHILEDIALRIWRIDPAKVLLIPNGVDCERFRRPANPDAVPGFVKKPGELIIGTVTPLRPEKNLPRLLSAFAALAPDFNTRLLIAGDGAERGKLTALARELDIAGRIVFAGHIERVEDILGHFDIFAMSSDTEQMPNSLLQAMAAGLAVAATDVGDIKRIVCERNAPFVVPKDQDNNLTGALRRLLETPQLRSALGAENANRARDTYNQDKMFRAYSDLYEAALASSSSPGTP